MLEHDLLPDSAAFSHLLAFPSQLIAVASQLLDGFFQQFLGLVLTLSVVALPLFAQQTAVFADLLVLLSEVKLRTDVYRLDVEEVLMTAEIKIKQSAATGLYRTTYFVV